MKRRLIVDHIVPGFVLLDVDEFDKFIPLTKEPMGELAEAVEAAERYCRTHPELVGGIRFSNATLIAEGFTYPQTNPEKT